MPIETLIIAIPVFIFGCLMNYFGFVFHQLAVFLWGFITTLATVYLFTDGDMLSALVGGVLGGLAAIVLQYVVVFVIGALLGSVVGLIIGVLLGSPDALAPMALIGALAGGITAVIMFPIFIIVLTAMVGSFIMWLTWMGATQAETLALVEQALKALERGRTVDFSEALQNAAWLYALFFGSGVVTQLFLNERGLIDWRLSFTGIRRVPAPQQSGYAPQFNNSAGGEHLDADDDPWQKLAQAITSGSLSLAIYQGDVCINTFALQVGTYQIGRAEDAQVKVEDPDVSRHHCVLTVTPQRVTITDNGSANGVWFKGSEKVSSKSLLLGDWCYIGTTQLLLYTPM